ncbi:hypothetical protein [Cyanobium sp. ATX 6A2]|uniref:hypothetical protein n=1 Tax=Cyanobium sp. ATX 6A2 TaxID=2823700 RepID=UPI0020CC59D7|nr:hypothetical protein [Cyanobium sp. ATX 6A2]
MTPESPTARHQPRPDPYGSQRIEIVKSAGVNSFYGHSSIIRRYCGYPIDQPIPYVVQHGTIGLSQDFYEVRGWFKREVLTRYWSWNHRGLEQAVHAGSQVTVNILGSPFLYLVRMIRDIQRIDDRGLARPSRFHVNDIRTKVEAVLKEFKHDNSSQPPLIFTPHSTPDLIISKQTHGQFAEHLQRHEGLRSGSVCMHPYDIFLGNHVIYADAGFGVASCMDEVINKYPWNNDDFWQAYSRIGIEFLVNLYSLLMRSSICYFYGLSTPLFYAGFLNRRCRLLKLKPHQFIEGIPGIQGIGNTQPLPQADLNISPGLNRALYTTSPSDSQRRMIKTHCDIVLGAHHMLSPRQLFQNLNLAYHELQAGGKIAGFHD